MLLAGILTDQSGPFPAPGSGSLGPPRRRPEVRAAMFPASYS